MTTQEFKTIAANKLNNLPTAYLVAEVKKLANDFSTGAELVSDVALTDERMSSGGLNAPTFRKAQRLKRELNLNINTKPAITYTHCCAYVAV